MEKISIRFYKDKEVHAVWDETNNKWWFSVVDIVSAITGSPRPRVYLGTLKSRFTPIIMKKKVKTNEKKRNIR